MAAIYENPSYSGPTQVEEKQAMESKKPRRLHIKIFIMIGLCLVVSIGALVVGLIALTKAEKTWSGGLQGMANESYVEERLRKLDAELAELKDSVSWSESTLAVEKELNQSYVQQLENLKAEVMELKDNIRLYHPQPEERLQCSPAYRYNPFSNTCLRVVNLDKTWNDAKKFCEDDGEYLATFGTLESAYWFITLRSTDPAWRSGIVWIGGERSTTGQWKWDGVVSEQITITVWGEEQPYDIDGGCIDGSCNCMGSNRARYYKLVDYRCSGELNFICERDSL